MFKFNKNMTNEELDAEFARLVKWCKTDEKRAPNEQSRLNIYCHNRNYLRSIKTAIDIIKEENKEKEIQREIDLLMRAD